MPAVASPSYRIERLEARLLLNAAAPTVVENSFRYETLPHRLELQFSNDVGASLDTDDLQVVNLTTGQALPTNAFALTYNPMSFTAAFALSSPAAPLPDGNYRAVLLSSGVHDAQGIALDGDGDGNAGGDYITGFFFLAADANHDRVVNLADFNLLAANFGQTASDFTQGDLNYDGRVNLHDFHILAAKFGSAIQQQMIFLAQSRSTAATAQGYGSTMTAPDFKRWVSVQEASHFPPPPYPPQPPVHEVRARATQISALDPTGITMSGNVSVSNNNTIPGSGTARSSSSIAFELDTPTPYEFVGRRYSGSSSPTSTSQVTLKQGGQTLVDWSHSGGSGTDLYHEMSGILAPGRYRFDTLFQGDLLNSWGFRGFAYRADLLIFPQPAAFEAPHMLAPGTLPHTAQMHQLGNRLALFAANQGSGTVSVFENQTPFGSLNAGFVPRQNLAVGTWPVALDYGTIGSAQAGLGVVNAGSDSVSIFRDTTSSGPITFSRQSTLSTGAYPRDIKFGDIAGDGKPDIVVANYAANTISIFVNISTDATGIRFAPRIDFPVGAGPISLAVADFDRDALRRDIVVVNHLDSTLSLLRNTTPLLSSQPTFEVLPSIPVGAFPRGILATDLSGDLSSDLVVCHHGAQSDGNTVSVLRSLAAPGAGVMAFDPPQEYIVGTGPLSVAGGDINGDGKTDVLVANITSNDVSVLLNRTHASLDFAPAVRVAVGTSPIHVGVADINGDARTDVAVANFADNSVSILLNNPTATLAVPMPLHRTISSPPLPSDRWSPLADDSEEVPML